ncbi:MAG: BtaA family protein [Balneolaceae bacterium]|nr:BtaA family protein [Balneolaceae bacterium]
MLLLKNIVQTIQNRFFGSLVANQLIYNSCWEDPRVDRKLLNLNGDSTVVMLTSAGCNALAYLLDNPKSIHSVDLNPNQTALLELKLALFQNGDYELLYDFFGRGKHPSPRQTYHRHLKPSLSREARRIWDHNINYFSRTTMEPSFYYRGTSGRIALLMHRRLKRKRLYARTLKLLNAQTLEEQRSHFESIDPRLWSGFHRWLLRRNSAMAFLGIPANQRKLIEEDCKGGLYRHVRDSIRHVFTRLPVQDNYFWRVYLTGSYTPECCPNYLKKTTFEFFRREHQRIRTYNSYLHTFLEQHPGSYSHFILLDHQDWLAGHQPDLLAREWRLILENARVGAKILFRSAGKHIGFLPSFVFEEVTFENALTDELHNRDRVATYGSTWLAEVNK